MEIPEVTSPENDEGNSEEEVIDDEERTDASQHDHEDDEDVDDKDDGEKVVSEDAEARAAREAEERKKSEGRETAADKGATVDASSEGFVQAVMHEGDDAPFEWLMNKALMCVPNCAPAVPGERDYHYFTRQRTKLSFEDEVATLWEKDFGATSTSMLVDPPSSIDDMMDIADGYQYRFPQQHILELVRSEYCNRTLYQFFRAKALKLEAKLRQRDDQLNSAEEIILAKDKEILELKE
ncbi:uncharacterized protein LOC113347498 [Papaver somniferum]|uniref:uncharacterized protein LOC113347498 n=1 Tax=Papaver somniferum TaxID=3469 RepID=UPI000E70162D|nr:uncharacterized protein LOC113347498 [Papaver somniferum]XP_026446956.1 uncharacterized protein LOC113347498 [Papaver somniferum]